MKYPDNFEFLFKRLMLNEGGFTDDPKDPGNWTGGRVNVGNLQGTNFGLASNTYPDLDLKNITQDQAKAVYYRDWWLKLGADDLELAITWQLWDTAVNSGMGNAKRILQRAANVADDGQIGPLSIRAIRSMDRNDLLLRFNGFRIRHFTSLSTWATYGKGWMNRVIGMLFNAAEDN
jgi:lysozyme family protein